MVVVKSREQLNPAAPSDSKIYFIRFFYRLCSARLGMLVDGLLGRLPPAVSEWQSFDGTQSPLEKMQVIRRLIVI